MQEKLAKARATAKILENVELGEEKELQEEILRNRQQSLYSTQIKKGNSEVSCSQQDSDYLNAVNELNKRRKGFLQRRKLWMYCVNW